jgi:hypothetical protein
MAGSESDEFFFAPAIEQALFVTRCSCLLGNKHCKEAASKSFCRCWLEGREPGSEGSLLQHTSFVDGSAEGVVGVDQQCNYDG